jgi:hypothetical protein
MGRRSDRVAHQKSGGDGGCRSRGVVGVARERAQGVRHRR